MEQPTDVPVVRNNSLRFVGRDGIVHSPAVTKPRMLWDTGCGMFLAFDEYWDNQPAWPVTCVACAADMLR